MKHSPKVLILALALILLAGCARSAPADKGLFFRYAEISLTPGAEAGPLLYRLGPPVHCSTAPSASREGLDSTYYYGGFYLFTTPLEGRDTIQRIWFADDTVATPEGIRLGSTRQEVIRAYGSDSVAENVCICVRGQTCLRILLENGTVGAVAYEYLPEK